jgi:hypothetical protein
MPGANEELISSYYFPDVLDDKFPVGKTSIVLCHLTNESPFSLNITAIMGSLNNPMNFANFIQNYTYKPFGVIVKSGEEITLSYQFEIHKDVFPAEYALSATVFYENNREAFSTTFLNQVFCFN